jgi:diguanylate cyclase (GGDEF)-like protein
VTPELLYKWSTAAQLVSVLLIALFYASLARSVNRAEVRWWALAWWFDLAAMALTLRYWVATPAHTEAVVLRSLYVGGKLAFVLLLVQGAWAVRTPGAKWLSTGARVGLFFAALLVAALLLRSIDAVGVLTQSVMGVLLLWCGVALLRSRPAVPRWLALGFVIRGLLGLVESLAYAGHAMTPDTFSAETLRTIGLFLGAHSSMDLISEWVLALGGVLAITRRTQAEMESTNADLLLVQEQLRNVADRDPLTALANRRGLAQAFRNVYERGAVLVFCDLDNFKQVNDTFGHAVGDACLVRFATAFRDTFRPEDVLVRYAGDEFIAVCDGMDVAKAQERVAELRDRLQSDITPPPILFSAGVVAVGERENPAAVLEAADAAMYLDKKQRAQERASRATLAMRRTSEMLKVVDR